MTTNAEVYNDLQRQLRRAIYERDDARRNESRANDRLEQMKEALAGRVPPVLVSCDRELTEHPLVSYQKDTDTVLLEWECCDRRVSLGWTGASIRVYPEAAAAYHKHLIEEEQLHANTHAERLREVCNSYGLPTDVDALVTHVENNAGYVGYLKGSLDDAQALQHVGWWVVNDDQFIDLDEEKDYRACYGELRPVFTHDDWLDKVPATERNKR